MTELFTSPPTFTCGPNVVAPYIFVQSFVAACSHIASGPRITEPSITSASLPI